MEKPDDRLSIVIPVLNDALGLQELLPQLQPLRQAGHEVLLVDGGSNDGSVPAARAQVDRILMTGTGRGRQMNLGAESASHETLLFLHADSRLVPESFQELPQLLRRSGKRWGRCKVVFDDSRFVFSLIATMMNLRSRLTGIATGDQGIFVIRKDFHAVGGYQAIALMEDIALSKALRKLSWPLCPGITLETSARRWQQRGVIHTILQMWGLRLAYFLGADPQALARLYYPQSSQDDAADD